MDGWMAPCCWQRELTLASDTGSFFFSFQLVVEMKGTKNENRTGQTENPLSSRSLIFEISFFLPLSAGGGEKELNSITHSRDREKRKKKKYTNCEEEPVPSCNVVLHVTKCV